MKRPKLGPSWLWGQSARLHQQGHRMTARLLKLVSFLVFRASLPPEVTMEAPPALMHHGLGVVVHPTTSFGRGVRLGHLVTIAASPENERGEVHPVIIEDEVFIGVGAILIARKQPLRIGRGAVIGAGAVVLRDVPAGGRAFGNPARISPAKSTEPGSR